MIPGVINTLGFSSVSTSTATFPVHDLGHKTDATSINFSLAGLTVPAGSLILVAVSEGSTTGVIGSLSDAAGNTYISLGTVLNNNNPTSGASCGFYCPGCLALSGSLTYTKNDGTVSASISAFYSTVATTNPLDSSVTFSTFGNSATPTLTSGSPSTNNELFVAWVGTGSAGAGTYGQASGWTAPFDSEGILVAGGHQFNMSTGTRSFAPTFNGGAAPWASQIIAFKHV